MRPLLALAVGLLAGACAPPEPPSTAAAARALAAEVDAERLWDDVATLADLHLKDTPFDCASVGLKSDAACHLTNTSAREFVAARFLDLGHPARWDESTAHPPTRNAYVEVTGTSRPDEVVLVGAHFDAFYGGADDNDSGVAVMLEVARLVAKAPLPRTVRFVGFDLEEFGLVGSTRLATSLSRPVASLVFDCVGYKDAKPGSQASLPGLPVAPAGDFLAVIGNENSRGQVAQLLEVAGGEGVAPLQAIVTPGLGAGPLSGNLMRSDHAPFWLQGDRAVFFTDTANFRNPHYHQASDLPATLDRDFLAGVARAATLAVATWGASP